MRGLRGLVVVAAAVTAPCPALAGGFGGKITVEVQEDPVGRNVAPSSSRSVTLVVEVVHNRDCFPTVELSADPELPGPALDLRRHDGTGWVPVVLEPAPNACTRCPHRLCACGSSCTGDACACNPCLGEDRGSIRIDWDVALRFRRKLRLSPGKYRFVALGRARIGREAQVSVWFESNAFDVGSAAATVPPVAPGTTRGGSRRRGP
jgi:hypothetical protein